MQVIKENGQVEEDMNESSKDKSEEVQLIGGFGLGQTEITKQN